MLANLIAVADLEEAPLAGETFVQRVRPQHRASGDFILLAHRRPALHVDVWLKHAFRPDRHISLDDAKIADARAGAYYSIRVYARRRRNLDGRTSGHETVS